LQSQKNGHLLYRQRRKLPTDAFGHEPNPGRNNRLAFAGIIKAFGILFQRLFLKVNIGNN
jgi:hypothetical protein